MKTGTIDPDLKAEIDNLQARIDWYYDFWITKYGYNPHPRIMVEWYAEKWALVDQI